MVQKKYKVEPKSDSLVEKRMEEPKSLFEIQKNGSWPQKDNIKKLYKIAETFFNEKYVNSKIARAG